MIDADARLVGSVADLAPSFADVQYAVQLGPMPQIVEIVGNASLLLGEHTRAGQTGTGRPATAVFPELLLEAAMASAAVADTALHDVTLAHAFGGGHDKAGVDGIGPHDNGGDQPVAEAHGREIDARGVHAGVDRLRTPPTPAAVRWLHHRWRIVRSANGEALLVGAARDVTADVRARDSLLASEQRYRQIAENSADFAMQTSTNRIIEYVSESITEALGWQPSDLLGRQTREFIHPDDLQLAKEHSDRVNAGESVYLRSRFLAADGNYRWMAQHVRPIFDNAGAVVARSGVWRDISAEVAALEALEASEETFRTAMESAPSGIALLDDQRHFIAVNSALCDILRHDRDWLLSHGMDDVIHPDDERDPLPPGQEDHRQGDHRRPKAAVEFRCRRGDGETIWVRQAIGIPHGPSRGEVAYVAHIVDVTDERAARERLHFLAEHDDLTGHLRPGALLALLGDLLARASVADHCVAALYVDVDYLKVINDTYGHACGDDVIRTVARRISATVRGSDLVGRIGGDEFVVVLPQVRTAADVVLVGEKVRDACREPVLSDGHTIALSLSMGGALAEPGDDPESLLHRADRALYRSKSAGRDRLTMYSPTSHDRLEAAEAAEPSDAAEDDDKARPLERS